MQHNENGKYAGPAKPITGSVLNMRTDHVRASFLFVGELNGHHQKWLGSMTMNCHGVAAFDFTTVSGCDQLVVGPTHARGGTPPDD